MINKISLPCLINGHIGKEDYMELVISNPLSSTCMSECKYCGQPLVWTYEDFSEHWEVLDSATNPVL